MGLNIKAANSIARTTITDQHGVHISSAKTGLVVTTLNPIARPIDFRLNNQVRTGLSLAVPAVVGSYYLTFSPGHGLVVGNIAVLIDIEEVQIYNAQVLNVSGDLITFDTPLQYAYTTANTFGSISDPEMNVDGSATKVEYSLKNVFPGTNLNLIRIILHMTSGTSMDDGKFAGISALTRGIVFRKKKANGGYLNLWNAKNNGRLGELAYDKTYDSKAPAGVYGMTVRLTYGGQAKHGTVIEISTGEEIQMLVQDDLTDLVAFNVTCQGHLVSE